MGIIFYEVLCGRFPFDLSSGSQGMEKIAEQEMLAPPQDVSPEAVRLIKGMLEKDWENRVDLESIMSDAFLRGRD